MNSLNLAIALLATWRLTHLIVYEEGPGNMLVRIRSWKALEGLASCFLCASVWTGVFVAALVALNLVWLLVPFALSAFSIWIEDARHSGSAQSHR